MRISRDDRYFLDAYQGIPGKGYTRIFERMLSNKKIKILLNTDFKEVTRIDGEKIYLFGRPFDGILIYTGPIDYFFEYKYGRLPYRSIDFYFETLDKEYFQEVAVVNYPNDYGFTRITEFKHFNDQKSRRSTTLKDFPSNYVSGKNVPCYPILTEENLNLLKKYQEKATKLTNVIFLGRLGEYRYHNMDEAVDGSLKVFEKLKKNRG